MSSFGRFKVLDFWVNRNRCRVWSSDDGGYRAEPQTWRERQTARQKVLLDSNVKPVLPVGIRQWFHCSSLCPRGFRCEPALFETRLVTPIIGRRRPAGPRRKPAVSACPGKEFCLRYSPAIVYGVCPGGDHNSLRSSQPTRIYHCCQLAALRPA